MPTTISGDTGVSAVQNGAVDLTTDVSGVLPVANGGNGTATANASFKNRIINGAMDIWQRGTSGFTTSGNYAADRFQVTGTLSAVARSTDVPSGFRYSMSVSGSSFPAITQKIESVNCADLVGQSVTLSFWMKQSTGAGTGSVIIQLFNATSTDSTYTNQIGSNVVLNGSSSWTQYTATFTNLPAGAANGLYVVIYSFVSGSSVALLTGVQLEKGSTATSFDYRPYGTELQLCQRYYETVNVSTTGAAYTSMTTTARYSVVKRATPTLTRIGNWNSGSESGTLVGINEVAQISLYNPTTSAQGVGGQYTSSAEL